MNPKKINFKIFNLLYFVLFLILLSSFVYAQDTRTFYCAYDGTFTKNLDDDQYQTTCTAAGLRWTGSLCCGEADDVEESYNDPSANANGGCWYSLYIPSGAIAPDTDNAVINIGGTFYGCNIPDQNYLLLIEDSQTQLRLIQNSDYCRQDPAKQFYCSYDNNWTKSFGVNMSHKSTAPSVFNPPRPTSCCQPSQCWNGTVCINDQGAFPDLEAVNGYRCLAGNWEQSELKFDLLGFPGYCPSNSQCLVNINGNFNDNNNPLANPQCISNEQYTKDNFCENGDWSSRTKFIASQLIDIAGANDYAIFCDNPENTLTTLHDKIGTQKYNDIFAAGNLNNFCVLLYSNNIIFGTSFNSPLTNDNKLLKAIGKTSCAIVNDNNYHPCSGTSDIAWYNKEKQTFIFSDRQFQIGQTDLLTIFINFIKTPFDAIIDFITGQQVPIPEPSTFVEELKLFDKLYLNKVGSKQVRGNIEISPLGSKNLVIEYGGFSANVCNKIDEYNDRIQQIKEDTNNELDISAIECSKDPTSNTYYVLSQGYDNTLLDPEQIWTDLTSKLRIK